MTSKISGYQNRPVQVGTRKSVARGSDAATGTSEASSQAQAPGGVSITDQARQLATLERAVQSLPVVNEARVTEVRTAIEEGRYEISPERIADKLMRLDHELRGAEK